MKKQICAIGNGKRQNCSGFTMSELLVVLVIMSILTTLGVSGLQTAVANARIKDAAINVSAYLERTANEARRMNTALCVVREDDQTLITYKESCANVNAASDKTNIEKIDELKLDAPNKILGDSELNNVAALGGVNFAANGASFTPRAGLSAAPFAGFFAVQYGGNTSLRGSAAKLSTKNAFTPMLTYDGENWSKQ